MKIDSRIPAPDNSRTDQVNDPRSGAAKNSSATNGGEPNDTVQLSSDQATVRQLVSQLNQVPEVRQQRVSSLQAEVQSGQFQRSDQQVANAIVNELFGFIPKG
jgi:flagellar biosynthesis anti-sigma factor FlgM